MKRRDVTLGISFAIGLLLWQFSGIAQGSSASSAPDLSRPYWVASGKLIAFAADDNRTGPSLWMMRADGSQKQRLAAEAEYSSLSPNGRIVADFPGEGKTLVFRTPAGKRIRTFHLRPGPGDLLDGAPVWAPNERAVAFAIGREDPADDFGLIYGGYTDGGTGDQPRAPAGGISASLVA